MSFRHSFRDWLLRRATAARRTEVLYGDERKHRLWSFFTFIGDIRQEAENQIDRDTADAISRVFEAITPDRTVVHGPFQGLQYGMVRARCSMLGPKLIGTYEKELFDSVEMLIKRNHELIIDVGSAEGYYSVGMARRVPTASIIAVDTDTATLDSLRELAELNGVSPRLTIMEQINSLQLADAIRSRRSLVISDCEGYESELLLPLDEAATTQTDFLIECHDFFVAEVTEKLRAKLAATHDVALIASTRRQAADAAHIKNLDQTDVLLCVQERRPDMKWIVATGRT